MSNLKSQKIYAFIDAQNLNLGTSKDIVLDSGKRIYKGWKLDFAKFRVYLQEKYKVDDAYLFIGYVSGMADLYAELQKAGYICIFKEALQYKDGTIKGNVDAELVMHAMIEWPNYDKAVIVTGDGDFHCLVKHLKDNNKLEAIIVPNKVRFSALLKHKEFSTYLRYMNDLKEKLKK